MLYRRSTFCALILIARPQLSTGTHHIQAARPPDRCRDTQAFHNAREAHDVVARRADVLAAGPRVEWDQVDVRGNVLEQVRQILRFLEAIVDILQHHIPDFVEDNDGQRYSSTLSKLFVVPRSKKTYSNVIRWLSLLQLCMACAYWLHASMSTLIGNVLSRV